MSPWLPAVAAAAAGTPQLPIVPPRAPATPVAPAAAAGLQLPSVLLSALVWVTALAALAILFLPERTDEQRGRIRSLTLLAAGAALLLTLFTLAAAVALGVAATPGQLHEENATWIGQFAMSIHYHLSVDGVSLSLLTLSTVLFTCVALASWKRRERLRLYCGLILLLETSVNGALASADVILFLLFFAMQAVPLYLLIRCFGGARREAAAFRAAVAILASSALLLVSFLLAIVHLATRSSDLNDLFTVTRPLTGPPGAAGFWLAFAAFAILFMLVPVHGWLIEAIDQASSGVAALVAGVAIRLAGYGMIRYVLGLYPIQTQQYSSALMVAAVFSAAWAVVLVVGQRDLRRLVAAVSTAQMALVMLAVASPNTVALTGAVLQLVAGGLSSGLLLLVAGALEGRARTRSLDGLGGVIATAPHLAAFWILAALAAAGAPLLAGFSAELMLFTGTFPVHHYGTAAVLAATVVTSGALIWSTQRIFLGPAREELARLRDCGGLELSYMWPLVIFLVAFGVLAGRVIPAIGTGLTKVAASLGAGP